MNIDELKTLWKEYDRKVQSTQSLSERMITSMIGERSKSRISRAQRFYAASLIYMFVVLSFCIAVFFGNPFDFTYWYQYSIIGILSVCIAIFMILLLRIFTRLQQVDMAHENLDTALKKVIAIHEKPQKIAGRTGLVTLIATALFPLSFLPRSIEAHGVMQGIILQLIPVGLSVLMIYVAWRMGGFRDRFNEKFKQDLKELGELKSLSEDLTRG